MPKTDPAREALLTALEASGVSIPPVGWHPHRGNRPHRSRRHHPAGLRPAGGNTTIAAGSVIGPGSVLTDAVIGKKLHC